MLSTEKNCEEWLLMALANILSDRMLFDQWDIQGSTEPMKMFVRTEMTKEADATLAPSFAAVLENRSVLDTVRLLRPDFLSVVLFFTLHADAKLQRDSLSLLREALQSRLSTLSVVV